MSRLALDRKAPADQLRPLAHTLIKERIRLEAGFIHLYDAPGLGVTLDDAAIERCQTAPWQRVGF